MHVPGIGQPVGIAMLAAVAVRSDIGRVLEPSRPACRPPEGAGHFAVVELNADFQWTATGNVDVAGIVRPTTASTAEPR